MKELVEEVVHVSAVLGHASGEYIIGCGGESEQLGTFLTEVDKALYDFYVVVLVVMSTLGVVCQVELFSQVPTSAIFHEGHETGGVEGHDILAFLATFDGILCICLAGAFGQSVQVFRTEGEFVGVRYYTRC